MMSLPKVRWPRQHDLLGVQISATNYEEATTAIITAAHCRRGAVVSLHPVHAIIECVRDRELMHKVNAFDLVAPDGQPVRWALNRLHDAKLEDRVYGPRLMLRVCEQAAREGVKIFLYGSTDEVLEKLQKNLQERFPELEIAGAVSPPYRALTDTEDAKIVRQINESGAGLVFLGLGCPKQDHFAADHRDQIQAVQLCVGAAFDFHAGNKKTAPEWMQRRGLEWLFRLVQEPGRLWRRYLLTNTMFVVLLAWALLRKNVCDWFDVGGKRVEKSSGRWPLAKRRN